MINRKAQYVIMELIFAGSIIAAFAFILVAFSGYFDNTEPFVVEEAYRNLRRNIREEPMYGPDNIDFFQSGKFNLSRFQNFGEIAQTSKSDYINYFMKDLATTDSYHTCMFILNSTYNYTELDSGVYAYGLSLNSTIYSMSNLVDCEYFINKDMNPCHHYEESQTYTRPIYMNGTYYNLYFVVCRYH